MARSRYIYALWHDSHHRGPVALFTVKHEAVTYAWRSKLDKRGWWMTRHGDGEHFEHTTRSVDMSVGE
jgi:hypothetical protein